MWIALVLVTDSDFPLIGFVYVQSLLQIHQHSNLTA